jgi:para-aminobenzoate synthetase/4-amino-4-deoxychorismate lyase
VIAAASLEEVIPALAEVEGAAAAGLHAVGFVAYEAAPAFDAALAVHARPAEQQALPLLRFAIYAAREEVSPEADASPEQGAAELGEWRMALSEEAYRARIERIRRYIAAGDSYQVNFTTPLSAPFRGDVLALYRRLGRAQRAAYCALLQWPGHALLSLSPELFFRWTDGELELRPMKGTRPRGRGSAEDRRLAAELLASPKERAENLMIVDLLRNDAGRIAEFGSVQVSALFEVERYATVHQLTSTIRARTRAGTTLVDLFRALFPSGSVTGAPKVRTSEIIRELESGPRGAYTGAIGYISPGEAHFNVAIRTLHLDLARGLAELGVGGGITHDSDAAAEYRECWAKARFTRAEPREFELLETLRWEPGVGFFLLDLHVERLAASADYFDFRFERARLMEALECAVAEHRELARVRCLLDRGGGVRVEVHSLTDSEEVLRVGISAEPVRSDDLMLFHKTTRREGYERRRSEHPDCDEVLMLNERGELTEATTANLVLHDEEGWWTPPVECGLLPGVLRAELLAEGRVRERVIRPEELTDAALYLINSVRGWRRAELASPLSPFRRPR